MLVLYTEYCCMIVYINHNFKINTGLCCRLLLCKYIRKSKKKKTINKQTKKDFVVTVIVKKNPAKQDYFLLGVVFFCDEKVKHFSLKVLNYPENRSSEEEKVPSDLVKVFWGDDLIETKFVRFPHEFLCASR